MSDQPPYQAHLPFVRLTWLARAWWWRYGPALRVAFPAWLVSRVLLLLVIVLAAHVLPAAQTAAVFDYPYAPHDVWHLFDHHDARVYLRIAASGYTTPYDLAFFPLYPLLIRLFAWPFLPAPLVTASLIVSSLCALVAMVGLARLAELVGGDLRAMRAAVIALLAAPLAVFLALPWSDSLTVAALIWALVFLQDRCPHDRRWGSVAFMATLATLAHVTAVILVLPIAWTVWRQWHETHTMSWSASLALCAIPGTILVWCGVSWWRVGDALAWQHDETIYFAHHLAPPWVTLGAIAANVRAVGIWSPGMLRLLLDLGPLCLVFFLTVVGWRRLLVAHRLYLVGLLALCVATPVWGPGTYADALVSVGRYLLAAAPCFVLISQSTRTNPRRGILLASLSVVAQIALLGVYFLGGWIV